MYFIWLKKYSLVDFQDRLTIYPKLAFPSLGLQSATWKILDPPLKLSVSPNIMFSRSLFPSFSGDGFSHRRAKSLKESKTRLALSRDPLSVTLSSLDLSSKGRSPRSPLPNSSLTRTMKWLERQPSPGSLYSSTSSLRDETNSADSVEETSAAENFAKSVGHDSRVVCESAVSIETGSHVDEDACASSIPPQHQQSRPIRIQQPMSRDTSLLFRRRVARKGRGQHMSEPPPFSILRSPLSAAPKLVVPSPDDN